MKPIIEVTQSIKFNKYREESSSLIEFLASMYDFLRFKINSDREVCDKVSNDSLKRFFNESKKSLIDREIAEKMFLII